MEKNIAVILCGSGYKDGSEIRESVATLWALSQLKAKVQCFAPDAAQSDVVNCLTGDVSSSESRNMLVESARIARGQVLPLDQMNFNQFDGLILPGGFGAAKNLCTFANQGSNGKVQKDLLKVLEQMFHAKKPIGAICISPAILALAFKGKSLELTLGPKGEASFEIEKLGHKHYECQANQIHIDVSHRIVSTPAYMIDDAPLFQIFDGIRKLVDEVFRLA